MRKISLALLVCVAASGISGAQTYSCQAAGAKSASLRSRAINYEISGGYAALRTHLSITSTDTASVAVVTADSVCDAVTRAVNSTSQRPQSTALIVVQFGNFFAACVADSSAISTVFILDDRYVLKTVLVGT